MSMKEEPIVLIDNAATAIRMRPELYLQSKTSRYDVVNTLLEEAACHAIDEIVSSFCSHVLITLHKNGSASVEENGNGIPVTTPEHRKQSIAELYLTNLGACSGFKKNNLIGHSFCRSGLVVTNALSESLTLESWIEGYRWTIGCQMGMITTGLQKHESTVKTGSRITFLPDKSIIKNSDFDFEKLLTWASSLPQRLLDCNMMKKEMLTTIELIDDRKENRKHFTIQIEN